MPDHDTERIEPSLEPPGPAPLRVPERKKVEYVYIERKRLGFSGMLLWALLAGVVLVLLPVFLLKWLAPPTSAFMLQSETQPVRYVWVDSAQIAAVARRAVVAAEDQKFWSHQGFDVEAIEKAYVHNQKSKRQRGASTISQQTAKNLFLWPGGGYFRKGVEAGFTVLMEKWWGKDRILEVYLNIAEFGPGIYGVEAASQAYFKKSSAKLLPEEAARLAAVLPSPRRWNVRNPGPYVQKRVGWVLRQMGYGRRAAPQEDEAEPVEPLNEPAALPEEVTNPEPVEEESTAEESAEPQPPTPEPWPIPEISSPET